MNAKSLKYMQLFENFVKTDFLIDKKTLQKSMKGFLDLDYALAVEVWDYLATTRESGLQNDKKIAAVLGELMFGVFYARAATKCVKAVCDIPSIRRAVYQHSPEAGKNDNFTALVDLLAGGKVDAADEILKCLIKNERIRFGETMKRVLEQLFIELLKKNPAKIEMSKKLSTLMLTYIRKIKTDERAMLEQRIREIM